MKPFTRSFVAFLLIVSAVAWSPLSIGGVQDVDDASSGSSSEDDEIHFRFILWIGQPVQGNRSIELSVPVNTTLFDAMKLAAKLDKNFTFEFHQYSFGNYITSISNVTQDVVSNMFWFLYVLPSPDVPSDDAQLSAYLAQVGVSSLVVQDGDNILFWYRKYEQH